MYGEPLAVGRQQQRSPWAFSVIVFIITCFLASSFMAGEAKAQSAEISGRLQSLLSGQSSMMIGSTQIDLAAVRKFYEIRNYKPLFILGGNEISSFGYQIANALNMDAARRGMNPKFYYTNDLVKRFDSYEESQLIEFEILAMHTLIRYASDLSTGRVIPGEEYDLGDIMVKKRAFNDYEGLNRDIENSGSIFHALNLYEPQHSQYQFLRELMERLTDRQRLGGWPALTDTDSVLRPGDRHPNVIAVRERLIDMGLYKINEIEYTNRDDDYYDQELAQKVAWFQRTSKIDADSVIGPATYRKLNVSLSDRIRQVQANLERWRLLPSNLGNRYILVDFGQQELRLYESGRMKFFMRVVIGQELRRTPTMVDRMTAVRFRPTWTAPKSIMMRDLVKRASNDPSYFERNDMKLYNQEFTSEVNFSSIDWSQYSLENPAPYWFQQQPGPHNALGLVRFNLNNSHAIYLHDTNDRSLFHKEERLASSGCVRVEDPLQLAQELLRGQEYWSDHQSVSRYAQAYNGYTPEALIHIMNDESIRHRDVKLKNPIPVYMVSSSIGIVDDLPIFGPDPYGQDERILKAMEMVE